MSGVGSAQHLRPEIRTATLIAAPIKILIVDDSSIARGLMARWLEMSPDIQVIGTAANGEVAIHMLESGQPEVILLDIEMPHMDGLTALPKLLALDPDVQVLMVSTLAQRSAEASMQALELGAADYIAKPSGIRLAHAAADFRSALTAKVVALGERYRNLHSRKRIKPGRARLLDFSSQTLPHSETAIKDIMLNPVSLVTPEILAIGASTGGPQALFVLLQQLPKPFPLPILITQHMPPTFTAMLAQHITRLTGLAAHEGQHNSLIDKNTVYVAPGDRHMSVRRDSSGSYRLIISDDAPENFCKPAVDPLFRSVAQVYGKASLCVVLTGMGSDGSRSAGDVIKAGGSVIVQDEASSVVWGMPGSVVQAGSASLISPLNDIAGVIANMINFSSL